MDVVLFEQHSGSSWIIKAVDWLFIQRAVEICEERVRRCCYSQGVPVADGQISAEFPGVLTEVFVSWHIRLHQTSSDFIRLHQTSSDFIRLHQTSSDFWPFCRTFTGHCGPSVTGHWLYKKNRLRHRQGETSIIIYWWRSTFEVPIMFYRYIYTDERWLSYSDARHVELEDVWHRCFWSVP